MDHHHHQAEKEKLFAVEHVRNVNVHEHNLFSNQESEAPKNSGWKNGIYAGITVIIVVLLLNISIFAYVHHNYESHDGISLLVNGSCSETNRLKVVTHLAVNILATVLLAASNYAMQVLCSPTRQEVDKAHAKRVWLDIGLPSLRNIPSIGKMRLVLWTGLVLSSLPLHLVYNSVIFSSFTAHEYNAILVSPEFLDGAPLGHFDVLSEFLIGPEATLDSLEATVDDINQIRADLSMFDRLDNADCIQAYARPFMTTRSDVVVVTTTHNATDSVFVTEADGNLFYSEGVPDWVCFGGSASCSTSAPNKLPDPADWTVLDYPIDHCLSRPVTSTCSINFSGSLMLVVIICNIMKLLFMIGVLFVVKGNSLITIGDAIASFLDRPDDHTKGSCLLERHDMVSWKQGNPQPRTYKPRRLFWIQTIGTGRMWLSFAFILACAVVVGVLLRQAIVSYFIGVQSLRTIYSFGFGNVQSQAYWNGGPSGLLANVVVTNVPQVIFSIMYLIYNGFYTAMVTAHEWSLLARKRQGLRVTCPQGAQRSTYFLQLPYIYGVPLMIASATAHWVISQSFFVMSVDFRAQNDRDTGSFVVAGFSTFAIVIALALLGVLLIVFFLVGMRRSPAGAPFVAGCSAAISAACHAQAFENDASKPIMWGVTGTERNEDGHEIGHCAFSSDDVGVPVSGQLYA